MCVYVNDKPVDLLPGMTVRHALIGAGCLADIRGITAVLETANGHQMISETGAAPPPVARPYWIYLPSNVKND